MYRLLQTGAWNRPFVHNKVLKRTNIWWLFPLSLCLSHTDCTGHPHKHTNGQKCSHTRTFQLDAYTDSALHFKFNILTHTHFFFPPLSCDRICPLFIYFEEVLGSQAAGALGMDINKWTVFHSSMRTAAKHPKQEILHRLSKGLLRRLQLQVWNIWSGSYMHARLSLRVFPQAFCECMHSINVPYIASDPSLYVSDPTKRIFHPSKLQQTKWIVPKTQVMDKNLKWGLSEQEINIWTPTREGCLVCYVTRTIWQLRVKFLNRKARFCVGYQIKEYKNNGLPHFSCFFRQ